MTAEIVNLRQARKRKARGEKERVAQENRAKFGRPRHERDRSSAEGDRQQRQLDGLKREPSSTDDCGK